MRKYTYDLYDEVNKELRRREVQHAILSMDYFPDSLDDVFHDGPMTLYMESFDHKATYMYSLKSPTWLDLMKTIDRGMYFLGDFHHVYVEGITKHYASGVPNFCVVTLTLGS